jgi:FKBP-type peptidyl-prolyl cis-trans isomerase FkpA
MTKTFRAMAVAVIAFMPVLLASCGLDYSDPEPAIPIENTTFASALGVDLAASTRTTNGAYYRDIVVGTGATIAAGQHLTVRYSGWLANGTLFDSNLSAASPLPFTFGVGAVIEGWDEGLIGIKVGGTRQLIIPPSLGYGAADYGPIPANSVLVFTVQVVSAQ